MRNQAGRLKRRVNAVDTAQAWAMPPSQSKGTIPEASRRQEPRRTLTSSSSPSTTDTLARRPGSTSLLTPY